MASAFELTPPTDLRIARQDEDVLELRTRVGSWWLGTLGLIALLGVLVGASAHLPMHCGICVF